MISYVRKENLAHRHKGATTYQVPGTHVEKYIARGPSRGLYRTQQPLSLYPTQQALPL